MEYHDKAVYVVFGAELQMNVNYGMPVRSGLYDMLGYADQIDEIKKSYSAKRRQDEKKAVSDETGASELSIDNGKPKIKLSAGEEFLSGMKKEDKLLPIVSVVVYFGDKPWDGPRSLFDMIDVSDNNLYSYLNDYKLNLISPMDMEDEEFKKFNTDLGFAMKMIKHQKDNADELVKDMKDRKIDKDTAFFLNQAVNLKLEYEEDPKGGINMCLAFDRKYKEKEVTGAIKILKSTGVSDSDIITKVMSTFDVTKEYVLALLAPQNV